MIVDKEGQRKQSPFYTAHQEDSRIFGRQGNPWRPEVTESLDRVSTIAHFVWHFASTPITNDFLSKRFFVMREPKVAPSFSSREIVR